MKLGDFVKWNDDIVFSKEMGMIVRFDEDNDPVVLWQRSGDVECQYRYHVEVLDEVQDKKETRPEISQQRRGLHGSR